MCRGLLIWWKRRHIYPLYCSHLDALHKLQWLFLKLERVKLRSSLRTKFCNWVMYAINDSVDLLHHFILTMFYRTVYFIQFLNLSFTASRKGKWRWKHVGAIRVNFVSWRLVCVSFSDWTTKHRQKEEKSLIVHFRIFSECRLIGFLLLVNLVDVPYGRFFHINAYCSLVDLCSSLCLWDRYLALKPW